MTDIAQLSGPRTALVTFLANIAAISPAFYEKLMIEMARQGVDLSEHGHTQGRLAGLGVIDWLTTVGQVAQVASSVVGAYGNLDAIRNQRAMIDAQIQSLRDQAAAATQAAQTYAQQQGTAVATTAQGALTSATSFLSGLPSWAPWAAGGVLLLLLVLKGRR